MNPSFIKDFRAVYIGIQDQVDTLIFNSVGLLTKDEVINECSELIIVLVTNLVKTFIDKLDKFPKVSECDYINQSIKDFHQRYDEIKLERYNQSKPMICDRTDYEDHLYRFGLMISPTVPKFLENLDKVYNDNNYHKGIINI